MKPDLELVQLRDHQSFKVWSHSHAYRRVRRRVRPERAARRVMMNEGDRDAGGLVRIGPNLPHNRNSDLPQGDRRQLAVAA